MSKEVAPRGARFGGHATPIQWRFELSGPDPALDFAKIFDECPAAAPRERLELFDVVAVERLSPEGSDV